MVHTSNTIFTLEERPPTLAEYRTICEAVGWAEAINFPAAHLSLQRSLFAVTAITLPRITGSARAVGMGRIVGDGAIYFYIQDIAVHPDWQGQGIGRAVMDRLMRWVHLNAPERAFVGLFAAGGREGFYSHYGFLRHTSLTGMFMVVPVPQPLEEWS
jgi:GNAT superfamily N-acetyltransferase